MMANIGDLEIRINVALVEEMKRLGAEHAELLDWVRVVGEETVLAGYPGGDRAQTLKNIRDLRADVELWKQGNYSALTTINRLGIEMERLRADAERYRWLCKNITFHDIDHDYDIEGHNVPVLAQVSNRLWYHATDDVVSNTLDAAIDAAMRNLSEPVQNKPPEE
jgi:hypothetical protein